ncbi:MAG: BREX protein BrxB domain-containing protein [Solirubrobacteraceae bacterium]
MPLRKDLRGIGQRILDFYARGGEPPYLLYVYAPSDEWVVRRDLKDLQLWLEAPDQAVRCAAISLADLFWQALEAEGWIEELVKQEREAGTDESARRDTYRAVGEILRVPPSLPERVIAAVDELQDERTAVFLYRAGALYPAYRTSTLIDDLRSRLRLPVTLLYPGVIVGDYGLKFMGRTEPAYGYRALIVPRGDHQ